MEQNKKYNLRGTSCCNHYPREQEEKRCSTNKCVSEKEKKTHANPKKLRYVRAHVISANQSSVRAIRKTVHICSKCNQDYKSFLVIRLNSLEDDLECKCGIRQETYLHFKNKNNLKYGGQFYWNLDGEYWEWYESKKHKGKALPVIITVEEMDVLEKEARGIHFGNNGFAEASEISNDSNFEEFLLDNLATYCWNGDENDVEDFPAVDDEAEEGSEDVKQKGTEFQNSCVLL